MNRIIKPRLTITILLTSVLASVSLVGRAAVLEEIVVTAQKREQNLSDVGISVTAFSGEQIKELGFTSTEQLDNHVPGLMATDVGGGSTTVFTIRGSGQLDFADHQEAPVAVYIDGVYNSYLAGIGFSLFDLERIEVLRGPQGTLYGRNATGGLIHVISAKPTRENEGYLELTAGEYGLIRGEGALSGPLSDTLSGRISLAYEQTDGYVENRVGDDLNDVDNFSGRAKLLFEPSDEFSVLIGGHWSSDDANGQGYHVRPGLTDIGGIPGLPGDGLVHEGTVEQQNAFCEGFFGPGFPLVPGATNCFGFTEPDDGPNKIAVDEVGKFERDHYGLSLHVDWQLNDSLTLVSITDWQDFSKDYLEDNDATPDNLSSFPQEIDSDSFSQELRLHGDGERTNWVAGLYYLNIDSEFRSGLYGFNCCLFDFDNSYDIETETYAIFAQVEYELSPTWSIIGGLRWTEDDKDIDATPRCIDAAPGEVLGLPDDPCMLFFGGTVQVGPPFHDSRSEGEWSGTAELDWRPNDDWLVYAKYSRGNKAGGYNAGGAMLYDAQTGLEYDGEVLHSYEVGFKAEFFGGRTRLNGSAFYYDYDDFQSFSQQGTNLVVFNTDAENIGGELELITNPAEGWEFLLGLSVQDAEQKDVTYGPDTRDRPMPNAPDLTVNGLGRYQWDMLGGTWAAQVDFNYVDERALNGIDHPGLEDGSYTVANARLGYVSGDGSWDISVWVKNLGDSEYVPTLFDTSVLTGTIIDTPSSPRWYGATVRYKFGAI